MASSQAWLSVHEAIRYNPAHHDVLLVAVMTGMLSWLLQRGLNWTFKKPRMFILADLDVVNFFLLDMVLMEVDGLINGSRYGCSANIPWNE
jgi:hypothetical protein